MSTIVHRFYRVNEPEQWREGDGLTYVGAELRSTLDLLDGLDQLFEPTGESEYPLGELLEVLILRRVDDSRSSGLGRDRATLRRADAAHGSPSVLGAPTVATT